MTERAITIDDIFQLFRESEQERKERQQAFEARQQEQQQAFVLQQQAFEARQQEQQQAFVLQQQERQQAFEAEQQARLQAFEVEQKARLQALEQERKAWQQALEEWQEALEEQQRRSLEKEEARRQYFDEEIKKVLKIVADTNRQVGALSSRWGEFVENLVRPAATRLFTDQGINIHHTALRVGSQDEQGSIEIDILAENTNEVIAIEVKSHLTVREVKQFIKTLQRFKGAFPKYGDYKLYGAVAGIKVDERADLYAIQEGLFVIKPSGDSVMITTPLNFKPMVW